MPKKNRNIPRLEALDRLSDLGFVVWIGARSILRSGGAGVVSGSQPMRAPARIKDL